MKLSDKYSGKIIKRANAPVVDPVISIKDWEKIHGKNIKNSLLKTASLPNENKYLLSHSTIMASVMTEDEPNDFLIKPECSHLVNNNEDGWENNVLALSHRSFCGSYNFLEHYQNSEHSKGHILDSILRVINICPGIWVYFCDILVATSLQHEDLVESIKSGDTKYMSMGCVADLVICSYCGHRIGENDQQCFHLAYHKGKFLPDDYGVPRRIAELCGHKSLPNGGVTFIEASWVGVPAFPGAVSKGVISAEWEGPSENNNQKQASVEGLAKAASSKNIDNIRLSDTIVVSDNQALAELRNSLKGKF